MRIVFRKRLDLEGHPTEIYVVKTDSNGTDWGAYLLVPPGEDIEAAVDALVNTMERAE